MILFPKPITVLRLSGTGFDSLGRKIQGTEEAITLYGDIQPTSGKDFQAQEVGRENSGKVKCYFNEPLIVSTEGSSNPGDKVVYDGKVWEVIAEMPNQNGLIPHFKYIAEYRGEYLP